MSNTVYATDGAWLRIVSRSPGIPRYAWGVPTKTYGQMCPLARSLDVLGERWTMLVIRELLLGPKRFKHLLAVLPAIGSNRLSERLRGLEEAGIVRKSTLPPPAAVAVYERCMVERGTEFLQAAVNGLTVPMVLDYARRYPAKDVTVVTLGPAALKN